MKAYLSGASIPSAFVERRVQFRNVESPLIFVDRRRRRRTYAHDALDFVYRIYLTRASRNSIYERRAARELRKIPTAIRRDSSRPIAVNKSDDAKNDICAGNGAGARAKSIPFNEE